MNHQSESKTIVARKRHRCHWCGERIEKGAMYESTFIVWEGDPWTRKLHPECADAERAYDYDGDTLYYEGQFQRGHVHEPNWSTVADGVSIKCPGCIKLSLLPKCENCNGSGTVAFDGDALDCGVCNGTGHCLPNANFTGPTTGPDHAQEPAGSGANPC